MNTILKVRLSGTLSSWNDERGFGFIAQSNGQGNVFLHISALPRDGTRPTIGEKLTYEMGHGSNGKPRAVNVIRQAFGDTRNSKRLSPTRRSPPRRNFSIFIVLVILISLAAYGYKHYAQTVAAYSVTPAMAPTSPQVISNGAMQQIPLQDSVHDTFKCDGRTHCSQMKSCAEAKYFLKNCPGTEMDGNHDGTPCEQQFCTSPFAE